MTATDDAALLDLTLLLLEGPDLDAAPAGEWGVTVARGYARRVLAAGWRPPMNVPPAVEPSPWLPRAGPKPEEARMAEIGRVGPAGYPLIVGTEDGMVTVGSVAGSWALDAEARKDFALLFHEAERQAEASAEPGCVCGQTTAGCAETGRQAAGHG